MITTENPDDQLTFFLVVHGIHAATFERAATHFACRRGGVRPEDDSRYLSLPVTLDALAETLAWVTTELAGRYRELYLVVSVKAALSWSEVVVPAQIAFLAGRHGASIKVLMHT